MSTPRGPTAGEFDSENHSDCEQKMVQATLRGGKQPLTRKWCWPRCRGCLQTSLHVLAWLAVAFGLWWGAGCPIIVHCTWSLMAMNGNSSKKDGSHDLEFGICQLGSFFSCFVNFDERSDGIPYGKVLMMLRSMDSESDEGLPWRQCRWCLPRLQKVIMVFKQDPYPSVLPFTKETMKVISIIMNFSDYQPRYDEHDIRKSLTAHPSEFPEGHFPGSMSEMINHVSRGKLILPKSQHTVVTVTTGKKWGDVSDCPFDDIAALGKRLLPAHIDPDDFTFREFIIPMFPNGGCRWYGLANLGCAHPKFGIPKKGACHAWYTYPAEWVRAHELGHNLGLSHAGGFDGEDFAEYGDPQATMGRSGVWSFSVPNRWFLGFLEDKAGQVLRVTPAGSSAQVFNLRSFAEPLASVDAVGLRLRCSRCIPKVKEHSSKQGGSLWLSYRGGSGDRFSEKVFVHLLRQSHLISASQGTELWQTLSANQWYPFPGEGGVEICSTNSSMAVVSIAGSETAARDGCPRGTLEPNSLPEPLLPPLAPLSIMR